MVKEATRQSTKKVTPRKAVAKKTKAVSSRTDSKRTLRAAKTNKVDYYPNRMTLAVSVLAGTILVLVAVIAVLGSRS